MILPGLGGMILGNAAAGGHRFVKVQFVSTNGPIEIFEIALFETIGGSDILAGLTVTADEEDISGSGHQAAKAHDGNLTTWWSAPSSSPPPGGHWLKFAADVGQVIRPALLHILPRVFITNQFPTGIAVSVSDDDVTYTPLFDMTTEASFNRYVDFEPKAPDPTGYRYLWFEVIGNNFSAANPSYLKWLEIFGAQGQDLGLQSVDFIGTPSTNDHSAVFSGGVQTSGIPLAIGDYLGIDLGKQRSAPTGARLSFLGSTLFAAHGVKNWRLRGNTVNNFATSTVIATVNGVSGVPAADEQRSYSF